MEKFVIKISEVLKTEYPDFVDFCESLDKRFVSELTTSDFIAYRSKYGVSRENIAQLRHVIDNYDPTASVEEIQADVVMEESPLKASDVSSSVDSAGDTQKAADASKNIDKEKYNSQINSVEEDKPTKKCVQVQTQYEKELENLCKTLPIYELMHINRNCSFVHDSILPVDFPIRAYNCLKRNSCNTYDDIFSKTIEQLLAFSNLGNKSLLDIIDKCKQFSGRTEETVPTDTPDKLTTEMLLVAQSIALGMEYDVDALNESEKNHVKKLEDACEILGEELCLFALEHESEATSLCDALMNYCNRHEYWKKMEKALKQCVKNGISSELRVLPFINVYKMHHYFAWVDFFADDSCLSDIPGIIEEHLTGDAKDIQYTVYGICDFLNWISAGVMGRLMAVTPEQNLDERADVVLELRQEGYTLGEIGDLLNITRERIRQIELKAIRKIRGQRGSDELIPYISAMLNGDEMIRKEEFDTFISDQKLRNRLWFCIENGAFDDNRYHYSKIYKAIVGVSADIEYIDTDKIIASFPDCLSQEELEQLIQKAIARKNVWEEKLRADISNTYTLYGTMYYRGRLTVVFICDWVLKNRFASGFKVNDETDYNRFIGYVAQIFGEEKSNITPRALDAKIGIIGLLCDRGKYLHPSLVKIDDAILEEIDQYIADSSRNALSFIELYEAFKERLVGTQISNHYFLQGVMKVFGEKKNTPRPYYMLRDYVTKDLNVTTTDELDAFIRERGIVHKSEIFAEFPALNEISIGQVVARCSMVFNIDGGNYIHASQFIIREEDYAPIKAYLVEATSEYPANIRAVFEECSVRFPDFVDRNELYDRDRLFAALCFMFGDEFRFVRPYIAKAGSEDVTNKSVILSILEPYDEIDIDELLSILDERGIHYVSFFSLMKMITPDYIRIDENTFMKRELTGISDTVIEEALSILNESVEAHGFIASGKAQDFIWYPSIDIPWTTFMLESLVINSDKIGYIQYPFNRSHRYLIAYCGSRFKDDDYASMVLKLVAEEYEKGTFTRKSDIREWLFDVGLIDGKLPNYLEGAQYYYMNENNRLVKREGSI